MNVIKIVVDELPSCCYDCEYLKALMFSGKDYCEVAHKEVTSDIETEHPSWCPLVVEDECVWVLKNFDGRKMYNSPESCGYYITHPEFTFCPNCSKRIRYEEQP